MKALLSLVLFSFLAMRQAFAGFEGVANGKSLGIFNRVNCGGGMTCTRTGGDTFNLSGGVRMNYAATAITIPAANCGSTYYNTAAVTINLPPTAANIGCRLTFITLNASNFVIDTDATSQILTLTNALGDSILNATVGSTVTLQAASATQWVVQAINGTWTDNN